MELVSEKEYRKIKKMTKKELNLYIHEIVQESMKAGSKIEADIDFRSNCLKAAKRTKGMGRVITDRFMMNLAEVMREG